MTDSTTPEIHTDPDACRLPPAFLLSLHEAACGGRTRDPAALLAQLDGAPAAEGESWQQSMQARLAPWRFRTSEVELDVQRACEAAGAGSTLVTWSEQSGWLAILDRRDSSARVARPNGAAAWVTVEDLGQALGHSSIGEVRDWLIIEAGLAGAVSPGSARLAPFRRLIEIIRPERGDVLTIVLYSAFIGLLTLAMPIAVQQLVNTVAFGGLFQPVVVLAFMLLAGLAIAASISAAQAYLAEIVQRRVFVRACADLAMRLPRVRPGGFGGRPPHALVNRFFDLVTLQKTGAKLLLDGSTVLLQTAAGLLILSFYHPLMLALSIVLLALMATVAFVFGRGATTSAIHESSAKYDLAEWLEELVRHDTVFRSSAGRARATERADALASTWVTARHQHYRIVFRQYIAALGLQVLVNTLVLALGGFLVVAGELTLGQLVASEIIVAAVVTAFARLAKQLESYYDMLAAVDKVGSLLDLPIDLGDGRTEPGHDGPAGLEGRHLDHSSGRRRLLNDVSLAIRPGERVALQGGLGSGRSVLVDILAGIRSPDRGYVLLDGEDLRDRSEDSLRDEVMLLRSPQILPTTVRENLRMGNRAARSEDQRRALAAVGLLDDLRDLPDGLNTALQPGGHPLSRGQIYRLEIARALLAQPRMLILDEVLSHLDDDALETVLDSLMDPAAPWTLLVVSKEARVIARCNRVIRLEDGRLFEEKAASPGPKEVVV